MMTSSGLSNHSDVATAAAFNVEVKLAVPSTTAAATTTTAASDEFTTRGQYDEQPVSVAGTILATATATLSAVVEDGGNDGSRINQLEEGVDHLMKKMGIHGMTGLCCYAVNTLYLKFLALNFEATFSKLTDARLALIWKNSDISGFSFI